MNRRRRVHPFGTVALTVVVLAAIATGTFAVWNSHSNSTHPVPAEVGASSAQSAPEMQQMNREPHPAEAPLAAFDDSNARLPLAYIERDILSPKWSTTWQYADGIYLSAKEVDSVLEFAAVDSTGSILWVADRPLSCTGFAVSRGPGGTPIAVLTDVETTDSALSQITASAYDLRTGEALWGPVEVPGPYQGPGLVFAASPEGFMGEGGERIALDPASGDLFEPAATTSGASPRVVGEYSGTVLVVDGTLLEARNAATDTKRWSIDLTEHHWDPTGVQPIVGEPAQEGLVMLAVSPTSRALIDLNQGAILNTGTLGFAYDMVSSTLVIHDQQGLHAYGPGNELMWEFAAQPDTRIEALGGALLYLREGDTIRAHNVISGQLAQAYDPSGEGIIVVPVFIAPDASALLEAGPELLLATIEQVPDFASDGY